MRGILCVWGRNMELHVRVVGELSLDRRPKAIGMVLLPDALDAFGDLSHQALNSMACFKTRSTYFLMSSFGGSPSRYQSDAARGELC